MTTAAAEVLFVLGTRPEIVKTAPVLRAVADEPELTPAVVHTGQHYDDELSGDFFRTLGLPEPDEHLSVGSASHAVQTADALADVEEVVRRREPAAVLAQGDTNAVLSAAVATSKLDPVFGHVEAGLRSDDRSMPEEVNRVLADRVADFAFAPTADAAANLDAEGLDERVYVTGNTVVDACLEHRPIAARESDALDRFDLREGEYAVATVHRPRNTDDPDRLRDILEALDTRAFPVVFPVHPRTADAVEAFEFEPSGSLILTDPLDYLDFLDLLATARVVATDSGGVQEEASILSTPCLTVRPNTERPETVAAGVNELVEPGELAEHLDTVYGDDERHDAMCGATDLYGDGDAGERIAEILATEVDT
ncbi:non-hydrolyzing UDP-N-acetylglucosamine 2-epimerase [Halospeciosus flavus]|uniref:Non-hydrolyzing UDP-N-acetylglucosamine 2-epimerase n=1 Tax=Halospeciosus flavus TaxID=3032283 RepID=A0ABD5Z1K8_9EURY|nr:UDP-N-acetylglucosamine 2-epimerase (non-hydrolyzing) [Halospeciosus flavus]